MTLPLGTDIYVCTHARGENNQTMYFARSLYTAVHGLETQLKPSDLYSYKHYLVYIGTYLFLGDVHEDGLELVEAVVDSLAPSLLHQRLVRL